MEKSWRRAMLTVMGKNKNGFLTASPCTQVAGMNFM